MKKFFPILIGFVLAVVVVSLGLKPWERRVYQPIAYNHRVHVENVGLSCTGCHEFAEQREAAGIPNQEFCMNCHEEKISDNPETDKIRQYAKKGEAIPWRRITYIPKHVYFSHRRHVAFGKIDCTTCHGKMGERESPPTRPLIPIRMETCISCHQQRGVNTDCLTCHR